MLTALKYKERILEEFYLSDDDITIHRNKNGYRGRFSKHDIVKPFIFKGANGMDYKGIHIPLTRTSISLPWLLVILREIPFKDNQVIDHLDGNITNNSRKNLRVVTQWVNAKNQKKRKNSTSGYTGINYNKQAKLYTIRQTIKGKRVYRSSKTLENAINHLNELRELGLKDGYTQRHGK